MFVTRIPDSYASKLSSSDHPKTRLSSASRSHQLQTSMCAAVCVSHAQLRAAVDAGCPPLGKLRMLIDVLDAPMKQIVSMWERHEMQVG